jgi:hypothetical protein
MGAPPAGLEPAWHAKFRLNRLARLNDQQEKYHAFFHINCTGSKKSRDTHEKKSRDTHERKSRDTHEKKSEHPHPDRLKVMGVLYFS